MTKNRDNEMRVDKPRKEREEKDKMMLEMETILQVSQGRI